MSRSVNMVVLVGNLTRDPEMRYTPKGTAVTSFGIATNRVYTTTDGEQKEEADFHNIVSWGKLAEICSQYLRKGRKVYVKGRIQTSSWEAEDGSKRSRTEIVADDMIILDGKRVEDFGGGANAGVSGGHAPVSEGGSQASAENISAEEISAGVSKPSKAKGEKEESDSSKAPF